MNDAVLFAIGSVIFLFTSVVTMRFMAFRFAELSDTPGDVLNDSARPQSRSDRETQP